MEELEPAVQMALVAAVEPEAMAKAVKMALLPQTIPVV